MDKRKKFKNEIPDKKDHAGLKNAGKMLKGAVVFFVGAVTIVINNVNTIYGRF